MKGYFLFGNDIKINGFFRKQLNLPLIVKNFQLYRQAWTTQCKLTQHILFYATNVAWQDQMSPK